VQAAKDAESYRIYCVILTGILCRWFEAIVFDDEGLVLTWRFANACLLPYYKTVSQAVTGSAFWIHIFLDRRYFQAIFRSHVFIRGMSIRRLCRCLFGSAKAHASYPPPIQKAVPLWKGLKQPFIRHACAFPTWAQSQHRLRLCSLLLDDCFFSTPFLKSYTAPLNFFSGFPNSCGQIHDFFIVIDKPLYVNGFNISTIFKTLLIFSKPCNSII
jgi:hypothetical protein